MHWKETCRFFFSKWYALPLSSWDSSIPWLTRKKLSHNPRNQRHIERRKLVEGGFSSLSSWQQPPASCQKLTFRVRDHVEEDSMRYCGTYLNQVESLGMSEGFDERRNWQSEMDWSCFPRQQIGPCLCYYWSSLENEDGNSMEEELGRTGEWWTRSAFHNQLYLYHQWWWWTPVTWQRDQRCDATNSGRKMGSVGKASACNESFLHAW